MAVIEHTVNYIKINIGVLKERKHHQDVFVEIKWGTSDITSCAP